MADDDYTPVALETDEDEERKKQSQDEPYPPVAPAPAPAPVASAKPADSGEIPPPQPPMPIGHGPDVSSTPVMPTLGAQRPTWDQYRPVEPHGWAKFGHVMAGLTAPTNRIFNQMPEQRAEKNYTAATNEFNANESEDLKNKQEQRAETTVQSTEEEKQARAEKERADAAKAGEETWKVVPGVIGAGGKVLQESSKGNTRWASGIEGAGPLKEPNTPDKDKDISDYLAEHKLEDSPANREAARQAIANRTKDPTARNDARGDRSYQFHAGRIDKLAGPIEQRAERISRLEDTLNQNSPQADTLVAPELLTVMAGGQGSGLRMNEAEISRIIGGRDKWESIKSALQQWQLDPSKPFAFQPEQRQEIRNLFATIRDRVNQKMKLLEEGRGQLVDSDDPHTHRKIVADLQHKLDAVDSGGGGGQAVYATNPKTKERVMTTDGGKTWQPAK